MDPTHPQDWWQYGVLGAVTLIFALVIRFLFGRYEKRIETGEVERKAMDTERAQWAIREQQLKLELEQRVVTIMREARDHEDQVRKENTALIAKMSEEQRRAMDAVLQMLQRFQDRVIEEHKD